VRLWEFHGAPQLQRGGKREKGSSLLVNESVLPQKFEKEHDGQKHPQ